ncbi:phage portal protein [Enterococcus nangangensis]|uniref:phage portal protein n=1 Tax=Enterococcus nangangensis TaxID=2559926 RepID=UPI0010F65E2E|nr:phage portal protein [Enterococcus nangangensis]
MGVVQKAVNYFMRREIRTIEDYCYQLTAEMAYKRFAIEIGIDLIANAMSKVEFKTYERQKSKRNSLYYRLNVAPNKKENATEFRKKLIRRLIYYNEVLIVTPSESSDEIFIADGWNRNESAIRYDTFTNVTIGNMSLDRRFSEEDVIYITLADTNIRQLIDSFYASYGKLIASAMNIYKRSNARRYILEGDLFRPQDGTNQKQINDMMTSQFKTFMEADNAGAVFQLQTGNKLNDISDSSRPNSRDIKSLIDDIYELAAIAFHIPKNLFKGDMSGLAEQVDAFLMFCILPLAELIQDAFNSTVYSELEYLRGDYVRADTTMIRVTSFKELVEANDVAIRSMQSTPNEARVKTGADRSDDPRADELYMTKNYMESNVKGGDVNDNDNENISSS